MSHLGVSESYSSLTGKPRVNRRKFPKEVRTTTPRRAVPITPSTTPSINSFSSSVFDPEDLITELRSLEKAGALRMLSESMRDVARGVAATGLFAGSYDNINMVFKAAEQIVGRTGSFVIYCDFTCRLMSAFRLTGEWHMCYDLATLESQN